MDPILWWLFWVLAGLASGSMMYSFWLGRIALGLDVREYGEGNPGATNLFRAAGPFWGTVGLALDYLKGGIPVGLAAFLGGVSGVGLVAAAIAPVVGHAFSPFLQFKGGKSVAVTFGVWSGLTLWEVPTLLGLSLAFWFALVTVEGWAVALAMLSVLLYLVIAGRDPDLVTVLLLNLAVVAWMHRSDLSNLPSSRQWVKRLVRRSYG